MSIVPDQPTHRRQRAVIYVRVSTDAQAKDDRLSIPEQIDRCLAHAADQGWAVVEVVRESHTGADLDERPEMGRVRAMVARREANVVLVWHPDRLSRDPDHRAVLRYDFKKVGARWAAVTGFVSDGSLLGNTMDYVSGVGSAQELERLVNRTRPARERKVKGDPERGIAPRPLGNQRPDFGLRWDDERKPDGRLEKRRFVESTDAEVVRWMFREYDGGLSLRRLGKRLRERGIATPRGNLIWDPATIRAVLSNPHYVGQGWTRTTMVVQQPNGRKACVRRPREEWVLLPAGTYPRVVDEAVFARVQDRLMRNKTECPPGNHRPEVGLLRRGIGVCGYCGHRLRFKHGKRPLRAYTCNERNRDRFGCPGAAMNADKLDAQVWFLVTHLLRTPEAMKAKLIGEPQPDPTLGLLPAAEANLRQLEQARDRTQRRLRATDDDDLAAAYEGELKAILAELKAAENARSQLLTDREGWRAGLERRQGVLDFAARLGADLDGLDWHGRRNLLLRLGATVRLYPEDGTGDRWDLTTRWRPADAPAVLLDEGTGVGRVLTERNGAPVTAVVRILPESLPYVGNEELAALVAGIEDDREQARAIAAWERGHDSVNVLRGP